MVRSSDIHCAKPSEITDRHFKSTVQQHSETEFVSFAPSNYFQMSPQNSKVPHSSPLPLLVSLPLLIPLLFIPSLHSLPSSPHLCALLQPPLQLALQHSGLSSVMLQTLLATALSSTHPPALPPLAQRCCTGICTRQG